MTNGHTASTSFVTDGIARRDVAAVHIPPRRSRQVCWHERRAVQGDPTCAVCMCFLGAGLARVCGGRQAARGRTAAAARVLPAVLELIGTFFAPRFFIWDAALCRAVHLVAARLRPLCVWEPNLLASPWTRPVWNPCVCLRPPRGPRAHPTAPSSSALMTKLGCAMTLPAPLPPAASTPQFERCCAKPELWRDSRLALFLRITFGGAVVPSRYGAIETSPFF